MLAESEKKKILDKLERYCAYQERCHHEVRSKLLKLEVYGDDLEEIISDLVQNNFLNEERFARSYARGKFRMKQWGRVRIKNELKRRHISEYCIRKAMSEIEDETYLDTAEEVAIRLVNSYDQPLSYPDRQKAMQRMIRKGYEYPLVKDLIGGLSRTED